MKVLLVSEGAHELGDQDTEGALRGLVSRLLEGRELEFCQEKVSDNKKVRRHMEQGKGLPYAQRALGWVGFAREKGFEAVVLVIDRDRQEERQAGIDEAQMDARIPLPKALGTAVESFDAWMLADERALSKVLRCTVDRQPDPEATRHPKEDCERLFRDKGSTLPVRLLYSEVARAADLGTIANRCPLGFEPFADRVKDMGQRFSAPTTPRL